MRLLGTRGGGATVLIAYALIFFGAVLKALLK